MLHRLASLSFLLVVPLLSTLTAPIRADDPPHGNLVFFGGCLSCHPLQGTPDGTLSCLWCHGADPLYPQAGAPFVQSHSSQASGTARFEYGLDCTACHHPHDQEQNRTYGTDYGMYVRAVIDELMLVTDFTENPPVTFTKSILSPIEFTNANQFIDGDADFTEDVCSTCHTATNHHQNDGTAPGGQFHNDGTTCTVCHTHQTGFAPVFQPPPPPHDLFDCSVCHTVDAFGNLLDAIPNAPIPNTKCDACHTVETHHSDNYVDPTTGDLVSMACVECHNPMSVQYGLRGNPNLAFVRAAIRGTPIAFEDVTGPYSFAYDLSDQPLDMSTENYVCNTCHTQTNHHQGDGTAPGGQVHFDGLDCTSCHGHDGGFGSVAGGPHPEASTDCSNCHLDPTTGEADIRGLHGNDCVVCHRTGFSPPTFSILGPIGSWSGECSACHNPFIAETGNLETPTKGHRCVVCHGQQMNTADIEDFHEEHTREANCVVCHGFIPDTGVVIGSLNRENCHLCHGTSEDGASIQELHENMVPEGVSCIECHAEGRPPVDVVSGPPVGGAVNVCQICHSDEDPSEFQEDPERLHKEHVGERLDCGACHIDAFLQDDREPMPPVDDLTRAFVDRAGDNECTFCHKRGRDSSPTRVHRKHVGKTWQWCYNCHEGSDGRPLGFEPPVTEPRESCSLCHNNRNYTDEFPFEVHERHADRVKCYVCHQALPPLFDWPTSWMTD